MKPKNSLPMHDAPPPAPKRCAMVLLSGGLDSVAAMHLALETHDHVAAVGFSYGQPNRDAELTAAGRIAERRGVAFDHLAIADAVRGLSTLQPAEPGREGTVSRSNMAARNPILLSIACAHACRRWPGERIDLIIGATLDDAAGFPDCRAAFVDAMSRTLSFACAGIADVRVLAPWVSTSKADVLRWTLTRFSALFDVRDSVSCYRGSRCAVCDACTLRRRAFDACGLADGDGPAYAMTGGDPAREARLK